MNYLTGRWLLIGMGVLASLIVVNASLTYHHAWELKESSSWVAHTHEVIGALEQLFGSIKDAESAKRGFVITGQEHFRKDYDAAIAELHVQMREFEDLIRDNPEQQGNLAELRAAAALRLEEFQRAMVARQEQGFDAARLAIETDHGWEVMERLREIVQTMEAAERKLLADREQANQLTFRAANISNLLSALLGLAAIGGFLWLFHRHLQATEHAAAQIHAQRELLRGTLISIGDGVIATDVQGNVTLLNNVAATLTGFTETEAMGQPLEAVFRIVNEHSRQKVDNPAFRAIAQGRIVGLANHTVLLSKCGQEWPIDDSAAPIFGTAGDVQGAILVFREISERKRQESELQVQSSALAEADQRKDEFLATLAHELRNPLAPICNALQLWPFVENNRAEMEELRATMERQTAQIIRLLDDLLDVSRITQGKIQLQREPVDISLLIKGALETVEPLLQARGHRVTLALPTSPLLVDADVARLTQVFANILNNAAKYIGRQGVVWVTAVREGDTADIRIRDNGPGIPPHMLGEIFEMFRQVDATLERAQGGLGIGLTLVKRLVEAHGGTVEARSEGPGQGSEFIVRLPVHDTSHDGRPSGVPRHALRQMTTMPRLRILVVDDVEASAKTLAMMLKAIQQDVATANDGPAAIEYVGAQTPNMVFLDIAMPGMNGYEVARRIRELPNGRDIVLVALTGYGQQNDRRQAFEAGFNHHLVKPASLESLEHLLMSIPSAAREQTAPRDKSLS